MTRRAWLVLVVGLVAGCSGGSGRPTAYSEGEQWTHRDLFAYLKEKELFFHRKDTFGGTEVVPPTVVITLVMNPQPEDVTITLHRTARGATDSADARDDAGYSWGRFSFIGSPKALKRIRAALEG